MTKKAENWCFITTWFDNLKDYVKISYELTQDGLLIDWRKLAGDVCGTTLSEGKQTCRSTFRNGKCYLKLTHLKKKCLLEEDYILDLMEIEVSQKDAKCQLAEKWVEKTVTDSELQVSEDDTLDSYQGREFAHTIDRRTALYRDEIRREGILEPSDGIKYLESSK